MRIAGIDITVDWSLLIIFALIATSLASGLFPEWHPHWSALTSWLTALAAAVLFFGSVLLHELSHSLVGRAYGVEVKRITLFVFGGMAQIEHEPGRWPAELWMAIVGPITSLAIGILCTLIASTGMPAGSVGLTGVTDLQRLLAGLDPGRTLLLWLGQINIVLAIFNLVPAFPLDGGRVLRALMWGATHDLRRATRWASSLGQAFAWLLIGAGIAMVLGVSVPYLGSGAANGIWLAFIGWFLNNAALMSYRQLLTRELLQDVPVGRLMQTRFQTVPADLPLIALIGEPMQRGEQRAFPVLDGERLVGMVCQRDIEGIPAEARRSMTVRDAMKPLAAVTAVRLEDDAMDVLNLLAQQDLNQVPVVEDGRVLGFVRRADILRWLALHSAPPARRS
jgi:Zn-dependent protease/CBS domain-containing protein